MPAALELRLTGGADNADPAASLGGETSLYACPEALWDDVDVAGCTDGVTQFRAVDLWNAGDQTARGVRVWLAPETPHPGTRVDVGLGPAPRGETVRVADAETAPPRVTWHHPLAGGSELAVPEVWPLGWVRLWLRRVVDPGATALAGDGATLRWQYV